MATEIATDIASGFAFTVTLFFVAYGWRAITGTFKLVADA